MKIRLNSMIITIALVAAFGGGSARADSARPTIASGSEIGEVFEAYLTPWQEGGEEKDTPSMIPKQFKSSEPSLDRKDRKSRGYGTLSFTKDLSKAYVEVNIEGIDINKVNMWHIHCGRPSQLGPIAIDFSTRGDITKMFPNNTFKIELTNADMEAVATHAHDGMIAFATLGCPINAYDSNSGRFTTIAGLETVAREGELYFNMHTTSQAYFGDMRGQLRKVEK